MSTTATRPVPSVAELRAAVRALHAGQFRTTTLTDDTGPEWSPATGERAVVALGVSGGVGATTVAVALATTSAPARVVECGPVTRSGLVRASFNELGAAGPHWLRGRRGPVLVERRADNDPHPPPPLPSETPDAWTVIDAGSDLDQARRTGWLAALLDQAPIVVVARATLPSLGHLDAILARLDPARVAAVAVLGPPPRRWPKALPYALGDHARAAVDDGRLVGVPLDPALAVAGLADADLPGPLLAAAATLADLVTAPPCPVVEPD